MTEITGKYEVEDSAQNARAMIGDGRATAKRQEIWAKSGGLCWYCGEPASQIDHVNPRIRGGGDRKKNLVPVCRWCNKSKRGLPLEEWRRKLALKVGLAFTENQRQYWGNEIPQDKTYVFWFERQGLS